MKLVEIFTGHDEAFSVGEILLETKDYLLYRDISEFGMALGYVIVRRKLIDAVVRESEYLAVMQEYVSYAEEHPFRDWFVLSEISPDPKEDLMAQALKHAAGDGSLVWISTKEGEEMTYGFVEENGERFHMRCIAHDNAKFYDETDFDIEDINVLGFGGIDCRLLERAYRSLKDR